MIRQVRGRQPRDAAAVASIRDACRNTDLPLYAIAKLHGIPRSTLWDWARRHGWRDKAGDADSAPRSGGGGQRGPRGGGSASFSPSQERIVAPPAADSAAAAEPTPAGRPLKTRLKTLVRAQAAALEARLARAGAGDTAADRERDARTLALLVRTAREIDGTGPARARTRHAPEKPNAAAAPVLFPPEEPDDRDLEVLRAELARHFDLSRGAGPLPGSDSPLG